MLLPFLVLPRIILLRVVRKKELQMNITASTSVRFVRHSFRVVRRSRVLGSQNSLVFRSSLGMPIDDDLKDARAFLHIPPSYPLPVTVTVCALVSRLVRKRLQPDAAPGFISFSLSQTEFQL